MISEPNKLENLAKIEALTSWDAILTLIDPHYQDEQEMSAFSVYTVCHVADSHVAAVVLLKGCGH